MKKDKTIADRIKIKYLLICRVDEINIEEIWKFNKSKKIDSDELDRLYNFYRFESFGKIRGFVFNR